MRFAGGHRTGPNQTPEKGLAEQFAQGEFECLVTGVGAVVGGQEVVADGEGEGEHAAGFYGVLVGADGPEQGAQVVHPAVVDAPRPFGDGGVAAGPVADRQLGGPVASRSMRTASGPPSASALSPVLAGVRVGGAIAGCRLGLWLTWPPLGRYVHIYITVYMNGGA